MKSGFKPLMKLIKEHENDPLSVEPAIIQFVEVEEFDLETYQEFNENIDFPVFIKCIVDIVLKTQISEESLEKEAKNIIDLMLFLSKLCNNYPPLCDVIADNSRLDDFIPHVFGFISQKLDKINIRPGILLPFLKFLAFISFSKHVAIASPKTMDVLFSIVSGLIKSPQLSAWACTIISGLCRNSTAALNYLKVLPDLHQIKKDILTAVSSNDPYIVCSALSAFVSLFKIKNDVLATKRAAIQFIIKDFEFPLMTTLATSMILDLMPLIEFSNEELGALLQTILNDDNSKAYSLICFFINFSKFHHQIASFIESTPYVEQFLSYIMNSLMDVVSTKGIEFLDILLEIDHNIFNGLSQTNVFNNAIQKFVSLPVKEKSSISKQEVLAVILNLLSKPEFDILTQKDILILKKNENFLMTNFIRQIEEQNSVLALNIFLFLSQCSRILPHWEEKIKQIIIDSQFTMLLVSVLTSAQKRRPLRDGVLAIQYITSYQQNAFFELCVSGFLRYNCEMNDQKIKQDKEIQLEKDQAQKTIHELETQEQMLSSELSTLKMKFEQDIHNESEKENKIYDSIIDQNSSYEIEDNHLASQESCDIKEESLSKSSSNNITPTKSDKIKENYRTDEKLNNFDQKNKNTDNKYDLGNNQKEEIKINEQKVPIYVYQLESKEKRIKSAQKAINKAIKQIHYLESKLRISEEKIKTTKDQNEQLQQDYEYQEEKLTELQRDFARCEQQNSALKATQKDVSEIKSKYENKMKELQQQILILEKEKQKWESIAKFYFKFKDLSQCSDFTEILKIKNV